MTDQETPFAELLKARRMELELTQHQAAEFVGVHREEYGRWERGEVLSPLLARRGRIAEFLDMEPAELNTVIDRVEEKSYSASEERLISEIVRRLREED